MRVTMSAQEPDFERDAPVVCVPAGTLDGRTLAYIRAVVERSGAEVPVVVAGRDVSIESLAELLADTPRRRLTAVAVDSDKVAAAINAVARLSRPSDLALIAGSTCVGYGWLRGLHVAATSDSTVASATPLSLGAGGVRLTRNGAVDSHGAACSGSGIARGSSHVELDGMVRRVADEIRATSLRLYPRIATMGPRCVYIRRAAWDLAGPLNEDLLLEQALDAMAAKIMALGMVHVLADDVTVIGVPALAAEGERANEASASAEGSTSPSGVASCEHKLQAAIACDERGPLRRVLDWGRVGLDGMSITIDARALTSMVGGTQTYIVGLIRALAREHRGAMRVLVAPDISADVRAAITEAPGVELLPYDEALRGVALSDVVHRPQQVFTPEDLALLRLVGRRIVIGQQDLIAYHNYSYHPDVERWRAYRRTTRLAMAGADQVVFFSKHARRDALAEELLPEGRTHVVGIGWEPLFSAGLAGEAPAGLDAGERFLLCLGADYAHKNRPFAIELLRALRARGFDGRLVLAGSHVPYGSSREREAELLNKEPDLADHVLDLGPVEEAGKRWLYAHARALLYPTVYEGFGLIPLEAAHAGLPCLFAPQASLAELAGDAATLTPWDPDLSALSVLPLLDDGPARTEHIQRLLDIRVRSWQEIARELLAVYEQTLSASPPEAAPRAWQELDRERYIVTLDRDVAKLKKIAEEYQGAYHGLEERVEFGLPLIDSGGLLSRRQQRGLMRIAARGSLGVLALAPLGLLGHGKDRDQDASRG